jgi:hypothetical protein
MAQDPLCRAPHTWEMLTPIPPPKKETFKTDSRIWKTRLEYSFFPKDFDVSKNRKTTLIFKAIHYVDPAGPEEEFQLFLHFSWIYFLGLTGYGFEKYNKWIRNEEGKSDLYKYFKEMLQILSFSYPPESHWVLKAPVHLIGNNFKYMYETFPDAMYVMTHRKVPTVVGSTCSLIRGTCAPFEESHDPHAIGKGTLEMMAEGMKNGISYRESLKDQKQFMDIYYDDFIKDPIQMVKRIYEYYGLKYTEEFETRMIQYLANNPQGKHGRHSYSLSDYNLTEAQVLEAFEEYNNKYMATKISSN